MPQLHVELSPDLQVPGPGVHAAAVPPELTGGPPPPAAPPTPDEVPPSPEFVLASQVFGPNGPL